MANTIILSIIGLFISLFFNWKQYRRANRKEKIDIEEKRREREKKIRFLIGPFNIKMQKVNENKILEYYLTEISITNTGYATVYPDKLVIRLCDKNTLKPIKLDDCYNGDFPVKKFEKGNNQLVKYFIRTSNFNPSNFSKFQAKVILTDLDNEEVGSEEFQTISYTGRKW